MTQEMNNLLESLRHWNYQYRLGEPEITDSEYDHHLKTFADVHPDHPYVINVEPAPVAEHRKQKLPIKMRSLDKIKNLPDLMKWFIKNDINPDEYVTLGPKYDGASLLDDNHTSAAWTRGGEENEGQRSDAHRKLMDTSYSNDVRFTGGEVIISRENWKAYWEGKINPRTGEKYKTLRGVVVGLMRDDIPKESVKYIDYIKYFTPELDHMNYDDQLEVLNRSNNVKSVFRKVKVSEITEELLLESYTEWSIDYEIDGIVININDAERRSELGRHERSGNPKYAVAYKGNFEERLETTVRHINVNLSKQGFLVPTVALDTVILSGAEIKNPTGYNFRWIFDNNIAEGSRVIVKRSGAVIPKIIETVSFNEFCVHTLADFYSECPVCHEPTRWTINDKGEHINLMCTNGNCAGSRLAEIIAFFEIMKFEDFGEGAITKLFDAGHDSLGKIINLSAAEIIAVDGLGKSTAHNLLTQLEKMYAGVPMAKLMHASNLFSGLGSTKIQLILNNLDDRIFRDFLYECVITQELMDNIDALIKVDGLAEKSILIFKCGLLPFVKWYFELKKLNAIFSQDEPTQVSGSTCEGLKVCFSGIRDKALEIFIIGEGGEIKKGVSKTLTHLIVADPNAATGKITKAKEFGCEILTIQEFKDL